MISLDKIKNAAKILEDKVIRTPLTYSPTFGRMTGAELYLKLENLQKGGSFKIRGATYKIQTNREQIGPQGVVATSIGNRVRLHLRLVTAPVVEDWNLLPHPDQLFPLYYLIRPVRKAYFI